MSYEVSNKRFSNFRFGIIEVLQPAVAADLSAECHAINTKLRIRRLKPPLQEVAKPQ
jgi:hypothetical protein